MNELDELEQGLLKEIAAKQSELEAVRVAKGLLAKKGRTTRPSNARTKKAAPAQVPQSNGNSALASNADMHRTIMSFRGKKFESADVTTSMRKHFPTDPKLPKKISRVLYKLKRDGKLRAETIQQAGSPRLKYEFN
jgi:hypothetical protein